jgi:hypothetical protein
LVRTAWVIIPGEMNADEAKKRFVGDLKQRARRDDLDTLEAFLGELADIDPPPDAIRSRWTQVWSAVWAAGAYESRKGSLSWNAEQRRMTAIAAGIEAPVPLRDAPYRLIAVLPLTAASAGWSAIYLHEEHFELDQGWALGSEAVRVLPVPEHCVPRALVWHVAAQALVPVSLVRHRDIHPHFFIETGLPTDDDFLPWHAVSGFDQLPTDPLDYPLAEAWGTSSKIGGFPAHNAIEATPTCPETGTRLDYVFHLGADFFDCEFGDAGSLHGWRSTATGRYFTSMDSA